MNADKNAPGDPSLPEDIAAEAGLPRAADIGHSLHDVGKRVGAEAELAHEAVHHAAEDLAHEAAEAREHVSDAADSVRERIRNSASDARDRAFDTYDDVRSWASDHYEARRTHAADFADRHVRRYRERRSEIEEFVSENPLLVGVVGLAAGLLLGTLLPRTRRENETFGPYADEVLDQGLRYARDVTQQGRAFVERALDPDNLDAAMDHASDGGGYEGAERKAHRL